jgi:hypothetical protein
VVSNQNIRKWSKVFRVFYMNEILDISGIWLARICSAYGFARMAMAFFYLDLALLLEAIPELKATAGTYHDILTAGA